MNKQEQENILPNKHLTEAQLLRYQEGTLTDAEMHLAEKHLLVCPLCSDALEGMELLTQEDYSAAMQELKVRLNHRVQKETARPVVVYWQWSAAASVLLVLSLAIYFYAQQYHSGKQEQIVQHQPKQKEIPAEKSEQSITEEEKSFGIIEPEAKVADETVEVIEEVETEAVTGSKNVRKPVARKPVAVPQSSEEISMAEVEVTEEVDDRAVNLEIAFDNDLAQDSVAGIASGKNSKREQLEIAQKLEGKAAGATIRIRGSSSFAAPPLVEGKTISGVVTSATDNSPLAGVNVTVKGSTWGTVTDIEGRYSLTVPGNAVLVFNFIGMSGVEVPLNKEELAYNVALQDDVRSLSEVVVTGYGVQGGTKDAPSPVVINPRPANGIREFRQYIEQNARYTDEAEKNQVVGKVKVSFYVNTDGSVSDFRVRKSLGYGLDEEAIRLIKEGPGWKAGTKDGIPARQKVTVKIPFKRKKSAKK